MPNPHKTADTLCALAGTACAIAAAAVHLSDRTGHPAVPILGALALFFYICALRHCTQWGRED